MSRVFLALDAALGRRVVVKVLSPELMEGVNSERFAREVRLAASLQEPRIVPVLTAGATPDGWPYYMMPFVDGESLRARITRTKSAGRQFDIDEAVSILRDIAIALEYAHAHGVVHRDIKPENVLLSGRTAVVTDFGVSRAIAYGKCAGPDVGLHRTRPDGGQAVGFRRRQRKALSSLPRLTEETQHRRSESPERSSKRPRVAGVSTDRFAELLSREA